MRKSLTLLPAGVLAAAIIGSACAPPPPPPPPPAAAHDAARLDRLRRAELGQGRPRQHRSHRLVGRRRHRRRLGRHRQRRLRRRHLQQRRLPDRPDRGARQPGGVLPGRRQRAQHVQRQLRRPGQRPGHRRHEPVRRRELHHPQRRAPSNRLVKLNAAGVRDTGFAPQPIPAPGAGGVTPPTDGVLALAYAPTTGILYAGGDFGKIGTGAGGAQSHAGRQRGRLHRERHADVLHRWHRQEGGVDRGEPGREHGRSSAGSSATSRRTARGQLAKIDVATNALVGGNLAIGAHVLDISVTGQQQRHHRRRRQRPSACSGTGRRMVSFSGNTPILNDVNPKGDVNGVELIGGLDFFGMTKGYGTNSGPEPGRGRSDPGRGLAPTTCRSPRRRPVASRASSTWRRALVVPGLVAVGDFTSVGTTGSLHGVAIFG